MAGVPAADALLRVLADRQVSPTVLSSSLFRHERSLRGIFGGVNFPSPCFGEASLLGRPASARPRSAAFMPLQHTTLRCARTNRKPFAIRTVKRRERRAPVRRGRTRCRAHGKFRAKMVSSPFKIFFFVGDEVTSLKFSWFLKAKLETPYVVSYFFTGC